MADKGIFIKVLAQLELASFAAAITKAKDMMSGAGKDLTRSWDEANASLKQTQDQIIRAQNEVTALADKQKQGEADVQVAKQRTAEVTQRVSDAQLKAIRDQELAEANLAKVQASLHDERIRQLEQEAAATQDQAAREKALADARKLQAADNAALIAANNRVADTQAKAALDNNAPILGAVAAEDAAKAKLARTTDDLAAGHANLANAADRHTQAQDQVTQSVNQTSRAFTIVGGSSLLVGAGFLELGKQAADFQQKIITLNTAGGELTRNNQLVSQGILDMSVKTGYSAGQLADAMLNVEKAGYHGQQALDVLTSSAQTARAEHADLIPVVNALTTSMLDYNKAVNDAPDIGSKIVTATNISKAPLQEIASSFHNIDPTAMMFGVSQEEVLAMLSSVVKSGMSPLQGSQDLSSMISHFGTPTGTMREAMGKIGLNADDMAKLQQNQGTMPVLKQIMDQIKSRSQGQLVDIDKMYENPELAQSMSEAASAVKSPEGQAIIEAIRSGQLGVAGMGVNKIINEKDPAESSLLMNYVQLYRKLSGVSGNIKKGETLEETRGQIFKELTGVSEGMKMGELLAGTDQNYQDTISKRAQIEGTTAEGDGTVKGFNEQMQGTAMNLTQASAAFKDASISIGEAFSGPLKDLAIGMKDFGDFLKDNPVLGQILGFGAIGVGSLWAGAKIFEGLKTGIGWAKDLGAATKALTFDKLIVDLDKISSAEVLVQGNAALANTTMADAGVSAAKGEAGVATATTKEVADVGKVTQAAAEESAALEATGPAAEKGLVRADGALGGFFARNGSKLKMFASLPGMMLTPDALNQIPTADDSKGYWNKVDDAAGLSWLAGPEVGIPVTLGVGAAQWFTNRYLPPTTPGIGTGGVDTPGSLTPYDPTAVLNGGGGAPNTSSMLLPGQSNGGIIGFHTGGVLPGYSPGVDNLMGMVNGKPVGLSGGEGILVPEAVKALGPGFIHGINSHFTSRRPGDAGFAGGGLLSAMSSGMTAFLAALWGMSPEQLDAAYAMQGGIPGMSPGSSPYSSPFSSSPGSETPGGNPNSPLADPNSLLWGSPMQPFNPSASKFTGPTGGVGRTGGFNPLSHRGSNSAMVKLAQQVYLAMGMPPGEWNDFYALEMSEAGFDPTAHNPTSTAYGMGQFLDTTWQQYGLPGTGTSDPATQLKLMMQYLKDRYHGSPAEAWRFHKSNNWYAGGGTPGLSGSDVTPQGADWLQSIFSPGPGNATDTSSTLSSSVPNAPIIPGSNNANLVDWMKGMVQWYDQSTGSQLSISADRSGSSGKGVEAGDIGHDNDGALHSVNRAVDISGPQSQLAAFANWWVQDPARVEATRQLIHNNPGFPSAENVFKGAFTEGSKTYADAPWSGHQDHVHLGLEGIPGDFAAGPGNAGSMPQMPSMGMSSTGMPFSSMGGYGMGGMGTYGGSTGAMYNPLEAAGSGGFTLPNITRLMTTFLLEMALGNPLGRMMAGQSDSQWLSGQNGPGNGTSMVSPYSSQFPQTMSDSTDAMNNNLDVQRQQTLETDKSAKAWDSVVRAQDKIFGDQQTRNGMMRLRGDYAGLDSALRSYNDTLITNATAQDKARQNAGKDSAKLGQDANAKSDLQTTIDDDNAKLQKMLAQPAILQDPAKIQSLRDKIAREGHHMDKLDTQTDNTQSQLDKNNAAAAANPIPLTGITGGGLGPIFRQSPASPSPGGPSWIPGANDGKGAWLQDGRIVPAPTAGAPLPGPMGASGTPGGPPSLQQMLAPPGGHLGVGQGIGQSHFGQTHPQTHPAAAPGAAPGPATPAGGPSATAPTQGRQYGAGNPAGSGQGFGVTPGGSVSMAESAAAMMAGPAAPAAQQGMQLMNRTIGYIGQLIGIGVGGVLETFLPNQSPLADPSKSIVGKIALGVAGGHGTTPNTAGQTAPQAKPKSGNDQGGDKGDSKDGSGLNITNNFHGTNDNKDQVNREQTRGMMMYGGGQAIQ